MGLRAYIFSYILKRDGIRYRIMNVFLATCSIQH